MFAVVKNGRFNGVAYAALTMAIVMHHAQYGETLAQVDVTPMPKENEDGGWGFESPTPSQIDAVKAWVNKQNKADEISKITVSVDDLVFDGDEASQTLMERHAKAVVDGNLDVIPWKMADNTLADVTAEQLNQAVLLAAAKQREIVVKYG